MTFGKMALRRRVDGVRDRLDQLGLDALFIVHEPNQRYVSGFTGSAGHVLITQDDLRIATDFRYFEQAAQQAPAFRLEPITSTLLSSWLPAFLAGLGGKRVGVEGDHLPYSTYREFARTVRDMPERERPRLTHVSGMIEKLRAVKEPEEIAAIQAAVDLGDAAFQYALERIEPDWTEKRTAWEIEKHIREHGGDNVSFETIVAGGAWSALPHAYPRDQRFEPGRPIVIDMGVKLDGYCSDLTRTIALGEPDEQYRSLYDIVLAAQLAAIELIEAGMTGEQAHDLAQRVIDEGGYGEMFGHGLGHGVGLEIHEAPRLGVDSLDILTDGMVMTIEPGIYVKGWGGVRIEDLAVMEKGRLRVLSRAPKTQSRA